MKNANCLLSRRMLTSSIILNTQLDLNFHENQNFIKALIDVDEFMISVFQN